MPRPSRNHDRLLIEAAKKLLPELGASGMSLKMLSDEAGVNPGIFYYHFKSKSNFIRIVLESFIEDARKEIEIEIPANIPSIKKLQHCLMSIGKIFRGHCRLAVSMYRDLLNKDPDITSFLVSSIEDQISFLKPLIEECQKDSYIRKHYTLQEILSFCLAGIKTPIVLSKVLELLSDDNSEHMEKLKKELITDEAITRRAEMAIMGIVSEKGRQKLLTSNTGTN